MSNKMIVLVRHAHRNKSKGREVDNGLSEKGRKQAKRVGKYLNKDIPSSDPILVSSPKRRCVETLEPLAKRRKLEINENSLLDEGGNLESKAAQMFQWICKQNARWIVLSSHGDWIPVFIKQFLGCEIDLDKGALAYIEVSNEKCQLRWLLQEVI